MLANTHYSRHRVVKHPTLWPIPDPPESWSLAEIEYLLWPDTPDHLPPIEHKEGWSRILPD